MSLLRWQLLSNRAMTADMKEWRKREKKTMSMSIMAIKYSSLVSGALAAHQCLILYYVWPRIEWRWPQLEKKVKYEQRIYNASSGNWLSTTKVIFISFQLSFMYLFAHKTEQATTTKRKKKNFYEMQVTKGGKVIGDVVWWSLNRFPFSFCSSFAIVAFAFKRNEYTISENGIDIQCFTVHFHSLNAFANWIFAIAKYL